MNPERQDLLIRRAKEIHEKEIESEEARRKRELVETLISVPCSVEGCSYWFNESIVGDKRIATRIYRNTDDEESTQNERVFNLQVGITTPEGNLSAQDNSSSIFDYAVIEFEDSPEGRREVAVSIIDDDGQHSMAYGTSGWEEVFFSVMEASSLISQASHS